MGNLLDGFETMEISSPIRTRHKDEIWIDKATHHIYISGTLTEKVGWKPGQRVDLMFKGSTMAFVPNKVGVLRLATSGSRTLAINSSDGALKIVAKTGARVFYGWADDGVIFFRPMEEYIPFGD